MTSIRSFVKVLFSVTLFLGLTVPGSHLVAQDAAEAAPVTPDVVVTRSGSTFIGQIKTMGDGALVISTASAGDVKVKWGEIKTLTTHTALPFVTSDGSVIMGTASTDAEGNLIVTSEAVGPSQPFSLSLVDAVNPPPVKTVTYKLIASAGLIINDGNTRNKSGTVNSSFTMRTPETRLLLRAGYNYAQNNDELTARNGFGAMKFDYFATDRLFFYVSTLFEHDYFQDLNLRTAISAGPGYQFIEKGDYEGIYKNLELFAEAGISYFDEDYDDADDESYVAARWSVKLDWAIVPDEITLFHFHEAFPSVENGKDIYITTEQGVRFQLLDNLIATAQVNWRWDNTPAPGFRRSDTVYLFTLGYTYDR